MERYFDNWLKERRFWERMTQAEVAEAAGLSVRQYRNIENGWRGSNLPVPTAMRIADVLHFDWQRFYTEPFYMSLGERREYRNYKEALRLERARDTEPDTESDI